MGKPLPFTYCQSCRQTHEPGKHSPDRVVDALVSVSRLGKVTVKPMTAEDVLAHKRAVKAAQQRRFREKLKKAGSELDKTGNRKKRPPPCPVTRAMADAGRAKLDTLTSVDTDDAQVTDDQLSLRYFRPCGPSIGNSSMRFRASN